MKKICFGLSLLSLAALFSGCATRLHIESEPAGAVVRLRGEGRASFRWRTGPTLTPCDTKVYYGRVSSYVVWPDGTQSEIRTLPLSNWRRSATVSFNKTTDTRKKD